MESHAVERPSQKGKLSNLHTMYPETYRNSEKTFWPFEDAAFSAYISLKNFRGFLQDAGYNEARICELLKVKSLQKIEPTHLHYYDRFQLPHDDLGDLIRLFLLRVKFPEIRMRELLSSELFDLLFKLGVLLKENDRWSSRVQIFCSNDLLVATDHRFLIHTDDALEEDPVMYIGLDSAGLTYVAPRVACETVLDLCTGSGVQALTASRYSNLVIGVDINPRAIRFARFNAQLNGIRNVHFRLGDLYGAVAGQKFDVILANPPFVPSPSEELKFRDGGVRGENILAKIIAGAASVLTPQGRLHIVTDLVDVRDYEKKLERWWEGGPTHALVLQTADRDDKQFSVPHCHAPFGQRFEDYNDQLEHWVQNFRDAEITAVNFGYILIHCLGESDQSTFFRRTISNPSEPIFDQVEHYFVQREALKDPDRDALYLQVIEGVRVRTESSMDDPDRQIKLFIPENPYYTTYVVNEEILRLLDSIAHGEQRWGHFAADENQKLIRDLMYKGILKLSRTPKAQGTIPDRRRWSPRPVVEASTIASPVKELDTETTPTCLSSYL